MENSCERCKILFDDFLAKSNKNVVGKTNKQKETPIKAKEKKDGCVSGVRFKSSISYTSISRSLWLMEMGLDPSTADMEYYGENGETMPCWSSDALMKVIPPTITCDVRVVEDENGKCLFYKVMQYGKTLFTHIDVESVVTMLLKSNQLGKCQIVPDMEKIQQYKDIFNN